MTKGASPHNLTMGMRLRGLLTGLGFFLLFALAFSVRMVTPALAQSGDNIFGLLVINQSYEDGFAELSSVESNLSGAYRLFQTLNVPVQNVKLLLGGGPSEIEDALFALGDSMPDDAQLVIYYYGLGLTTVADGKNLAVLPELSLRETSESRLVQRRLKRSTLPLATLARDLEFTPAKQKLIIYDACAVPALTGGEDALYWAEVNKTPCIPQPVEGADVIFGAPGVSQSTLLNVLTDVLAKDSAQPLSALSTNLQAEFVNRFDLAEDAASLVQTDPEFESAARCLYSPDASSGLCTAEIETESTEEEPRIVAEVEGDDVASATEETTETPVASAEDASDAPAGDDTVEDDEESEQDEVFTARQGVGNAQEMQGDWNAAKAANKCDGYTEFLLKHPTSPFALKAQFTLKRVCSPEELAAFEVAKAEAEKAAKAEPVEEIVADSGVAEGTGDQSSDEDVVQENTEEPQDTDVAGNETSPVKPIPIEPSASAQEAVSVREAWLNAKGTNTCSAYLTFERDYPGSPFALKAKFAADRACTAKDRAIFEQESAQPEPSEDVIVADEEPIEEDVVIQEPDPTEEIKEDSGDVAEETGQDAGNVAEVEPEAPEEVEPVTQPVEDENRALTSREAWQIWRAHDTCHGYLSFVQGYSDAFYRLRADRAVQANCSETQRLAFTSGKLNADDTIGTPRPKPADEPVVDDTPIVTSEGDPETTVPSDTAPIPKGERKKAYAFVLINDEYESEDIYGPIAGPDYEAFQQILTTVGIPEERVKVMRNADRIDIEEEAFSFALEMEPGSDLLVYYFGHSLSRLGSREILIVPSSFQIPSTKQVRLSRRRIDENTIGLRALLRDLREGSPSRVTVIYNGCGTIPLRGGDEEPYWEFTSRFACDGAAIPGASILFPVKPDQSSIFDLTESDGVASPFMDVMLTTLQKNPFIGLSELGRTLAWEVPQLIRPDDPPEVPVLLNDPELTDGQFDGRCFVPMILNGQEQCADLEGQLPDAQGALEEPVEQPQDEPVVTTPDEDATPDPQNETTDAMRLDWLAARQVNTCAAFTDFQAKYPGSEFAAFAELRLAALCTEDEQTPEADEETTTAEVEPLPAYCAPEAEDPDTGALAREGFRLVQQRLNELGCDVGGADGLWGRNSQRGFDLFKSEARVSWSEGEPVCGTVARLQAHPDGRVCPLVCRAGFRKEGDRCVRIPATTSTTSSSGSSNTGNTQPARQTTTNTTPTPAPTPAPAQSSVNCGPLQVKTANGCVARNIGVFR
ncbi:MAG: hypothetical protein ACU0BB_04675 [Paracoccaceae bacterium]